jgi:outer membrane protein TolC
MKRAAKTAVLCIVLSLILLGPATKGAAEATVGMTLDALVEAAMERNPEIKASEARWQAFSERVRQAGTFEDPMLMLKIQNALVRDPLNFNREAMTAKVIGVSQMLPFFGKRALQREGAERAAEGERWSFEERKVELRRMVKETWYQLYYIARSLEIVEKNIDILDDLTRFTETMYGVGQGLQQDVLKAQVERSKMEEMRISLRQKRRSLEATLNTLLYRPAGTVVPTIAEVDFTPVDFDEAELERLASENRPLIRTLTTQVEKARVSRKVGEKEFYPDFTVSLEYMQRDPAMGGEGYDMYSAGVTFNLPVQRGRRHAMVAEAESETRMAQEELSMLRNQIRFGITDALARLERSRKLAELYREGLLPQAAHALEAALSAYRVGRADFMNVLDSQMALFNFEREYFDAVAEHQMQLAVLEGVIGMPLPLPEK